MINISHQNKSSVGEITIDVVIPTCARPDILRRPLQSLGQANWPDSFRAVYVVENGQDVGAKELCSEYEKDYPIRYLYEPRAGSSYARNRGVEASDADVIVFFDDDVSVSTGVLEAYDKAIRDNGLGYFYGGPVEPAYDKAPEAWLKPFLPPSARGFNDGVENHRVIQPCFMGANMAVARGLLDEAGHFDEVCAFGLGGTLGEETRLQERLLDKGYRGYYVAGALVWHYVPENRCTPEWALERSYRTGLTEGVMGARHGRSNRSVAGVPVWLWRRYVGARLHALIGRWAGEERETQFGYRAELRRLEGVKVGYRSGGDVDEVAQMNVNRSRG